MELGLDFYLEYVENMNKMHNFGVSPEAEKLIAQMAHYFGLASYRPMGRLLLQNWNVLEKRVAEYTEEEWAQAKAISDSCHGALSPLAIAIFLEVMEGDDTPEQARIKTILTDEEIANMMKVFELEAQRLEAAKKSVE